MLGSDAILLPSLWALGVLPALNPAGSLGQVPSRFSLQDKDGTCLQVVMESM